MEPVLRAGGSPLRRILKRAGALERRMGVLWWHTGWMFAVSRAGDLISLYIGIFIVPDVLSRDELGAVLPLTTLIPFVALPITVIMMAAVKYIGTFHAEGQLGKVRALIGDLVRMTAVLSVLLMVALVALRTPIQNSLRIQSPLVVVLVGLSAIATCWMPLVTAVCQGLKHFYRITLTKLAGPVARLGVVLLLLRPLGLAGYVASLFAATLAQVALLATGLRSVAIVQAERESYSEHKRAMVRYALTAGLFSLVSTWQAFFEPWMIRHALSPADSAGYYVAAMFGNIPLWVAPAMTPFLFPLLSERHETGRSTRPMHLQSLGAILAIGVAVAAALALLMPWMLTLRASWREYAAYAPFAWRQAVITTLSVLIGTHALCQTACRRFGFLWYCVPLVAIETAVIFAWAPGHGPAADQWWQHAFGKDLNAILRLMLGVRLATVCLALLEWRDFWPSVGHTPRGGNLHPRGGGIAPCVYS
jgi:O-antigen/teichoic acid export membrane protein